MDPLANPVVSAAAAEVAGHRVVDVGKRRIRVSFQQRRSGHDLTGLAVAALCDIEFAPGLLQWVQVFVVGGEALDRSNLHATGGGNRCEAGTSGHTVEMHGAGATLANAATVFGPDKIEIITKHPEKGGIGGNIHGPGLAVYVQSEFGHNDRGVRGKTR